MTMSNQSYFDFTPKGIPPRDLLVVDNHETTEKIRCLNQQTKELFHPTTLRFAIKEGCEDQLARLTEEMLD